MVQTIAEAVNVLGREVASSLYRAWTPPTLPEQGALTIGATADFILLADGNGIAYATKPA